MKKIVALLLCLASICTYAQKKSRNVYTLANGKLEVFDSSTGKWIPKIRGSSLNDSDWVRADRSFSLRDKKGYSRAYSQCDCTLVSKLSVMTMVSAEIRKNDVITRELAECGFALSCNHLTLKSGDKWELAIVFTSEDYAGAECSVTPEQDWIVVDGVSETVDGKKVISGSILPGLVVNGDVLEGNCRVVCKGISSTVRFTVVPGDSDKQ